MSDEVDSNEQSVQARAALAPVRFLLGRWTGRGTSHGEPVQAELEVREVLDGTFLEATERQLDGEGRVDHEDRAFYRYDRMEGRLKVTHLMAPAFVTERVVLPLDDGPGVKWFGGPYALVVKLRPDGDELVVSVHAPFTVEAETEVRYRRAEG